MNSLQRIRWGMAFTLGLLLGMSLFSVHVVKSFSEAGDGVLHTTQVQQKLEKVLTLLRKTEAESRGYVLTGEEGFLRSFETLKAELRTTFDELRVLTRDNPRQRRRVDEMEPKLLQKIVSTAHGLEISRQDGAVRGHDGFVATHEEAKLSDSLQHTIAEMQSEENGLLARRLGEARRNAGMAIMTLAAGLLFDFVLLVALFALIFRERREREQAAAALRKSSEEIRDLYNQAPCGYHSLNGDGTYVAINDTELGWLGCSREEVLGKRCFAEFLDEAERARFFSNFERFKREGRVTDMEFTLVRRDGGRLPVLVNAIAVFDDAGRFVASRSTVVDIKARLETEQAIRQAKTYAESIVDTVREPLVILTHELRVRSANRSFYQTFRTTPEAIEGCLFAELENRIWAIPDLLEALGSVVPNQTTVTDFEVDREFPRLGRKVMLLNARKLFRPGNHTTMILLAIEDVTARKQAMEELESFSYSVSHDLRAPLRHIEGYAGMLESGLGEVPERELQRYVEVITASTRRMSTLIDDLLALSRVGRTALQRVTLAPEQLVDEARQELETEVAGREIEWRVAPMPKVVGDRTLLGQVFVNLLSNAVKYTRKRSPAVIEVFAREEVPQEVVIGVRDNGAGFDMRYADKLFRVFQRLHSASEFEGTGVGLAIVHRIVQRHGGRIWAEGKVGEGATFYFTLPRSA